MCNPNPYVIYFSGVIFVAIVDAIRWYMWYNEVDTLEVDYGRIARNVLAVLCSWASCVLPIVVIGAAILPAIAESEFWKKKITFTKRKTKK